MDFWLSLIVDGVQIAALVIAISLGVRTFGEKGAPDGYWQIATRYDGSQWVPIALKVVVVNVGSKSLLVRSVGRRDSSGGLSVGLATAEAHNFLGIVKIPPSSAMDFVLRAGETRIILLELLPDESLPCVDLSIPAVICYITPRRRFGFVGTRKLVQRDFQLSRLKD